LFRPFAQASEEVARRYGGAGLGLVFVKRIAEAMGGRLTVTSRPGRGSTFLLSVVVDRARSDVPGERAVVRAKEAGLRVLVAEDNPYGRVVLRAVLTELGHQVRFVGSGEAAVKAVAGGDVDVVIMDVALPGIDGVAATRRIRRLSPPAGRTPVIGVSGRTGMADAEAAVKAGMNVYLRKPASATALHEALSAFAPRPRPVRRA
jgi:CheY-like chemotaxis protein